MGVTLHLRPFSLPVLLLLASPVYARIIKLKVLLTYQSRGIAFTQWIELFTVCLAPLIAHVAAGAPAPTILKKHKFKSLHWTLRLTHFNPVSIVWRYNVIVDRRVRALRWDELDMAACNAIFWDDEQRRWDGSEDIMIRSRQWITKTPDTSHVSIVSKSTLITVVSALQGAQAIGLILGVLIPKLTRLQDGLPYLFVPLGVLSLLRLPAAPWLTSEYGYLNCEETVGGVIPVEKKSSILPGVKEMVDDRLLPRRSWQGVVYRIWWIFSVWLIMGTSAVITTHLWWKIGPGPHILYSSTTNMMFSIMYFTLTAPGSLIITAYVLLGQTSSTIIPCIHSAWYKVYTLLVMTLALTTIIIAAIETRLSRNGVATTYPEFDCSPSGGGLYGGFFPVYGGVGNCTGRFPHR